MAKAIMINTNHPTQPTTGASLDRGRSFLATAQREREIIAKAKNSNANFVLPGESPGGNTPSAWRTKPVHATLIAMAKPRSPAVANFLRGCNGATSLFLRFRSIVQCEFAHHFFVFDCVGYGQGFFARKICCSHIERPLHKFSGRLRGSRIIRFLASVIL